MARQGERAQDPLVWVVAARSALLAQSCGRGQAVSPPRRGGRARAGGLRLKGAPGERFGL